jgi:hypothetical protein
MLGQVIEVNVSEKKKIGKGQWIRTTILSVEQTKSNIMVTFKKDDKTEKREWNIKIMDFCGEHLQEKCDPDHMRPDKARLFHKKYIFATSDKKEEYVKRLKEAKISK